MANDAFTDWMSGIQHTMETELSHVLPAAESAPQRLHRAMRHSTLGGGKRVRPLLLFAAGEMLGAASTVMAPLAAAVEMVHVYSLIHDDLPCMDDDTLRRGKPTCHVAFDEATALLAGDALQTLAFDLASRPLPGLAAERQLAIVSTLARASGFAGMAGGQAIDLASTGQHLTLPELEYMHSLKTGALIRAAIRIGALAGRTLDAAESASLDRFAKRIGLAFQVVDDILDCEADTATLGKTAGKDAAHDKATYVSLMGLPEARGFAAELREQAFDALEGFGANAQRLKDLADYIVVRSF